MNVSLILTTLLQPSFYLYFTSNQDCFYMHGNNTSAYLFGKNDTVYLQLLNNGRVAEYNRSIKGDVFSFEWPSTKLNGESMTEKVEMSFKTILLLQEPMLPEHEPVYLCKEYSKLYLLLALVIGFFFGFPIPTDAMIQSLKDAHFQRL